MSRSKRAGGARSKSTTAPVRSVHRHEDFPAEVAPESQDVRHIEVTPEVKNAAQKALDAFSKVDLVELSQSGVSDLLLRFSGQAEASAFRIKFQGPVATPANNKPRISSTTGHTVKVGIDQYLPDSFTELLGDVAESDVASLPVRKRLIEKLDDFVGTFANAGILRILLDSPQEEPSPELEPIRLSLTAAHKALVAAADRMRQVITDNPVHLVRIETSASALKPFNITVDGESVELLSRAQRALCALALLLPEPPVKIDAFMKLYSGDATDARRDFHTITRDLKKLLPRLSWKAAKGNRWISGLHVQSEVSTMQLRQFLEEHRK